ncbi:MAG TPA: terpene synthase family protein [Thermomicrobiales bacterium]|nr:terpene synthase family protein [Thermomicrobiales bacterium]
MSGATLTAATDLPQTRVERARREVQADLAAWVRRYPVFNPARFPPLALTTAVHLPDAPRADRALAALVSLWIIAFDDLVDEARLAGPALRELAAGYTLLVHAGPGRAPVAAPPPGPLPATAQLAAALREIARGVARRDPPAPLAAYWRATFARMVDSIVAQKELGAALDAPGALVPSGPAPSGPAPSRVLGVLGVLGAVPSYDRALALLEESIGVPHYLATCFILAGDPTLPGRLPRLLPLVGACARAIRLANDLHTWPKDERERNLNTLVAARADLARAEPDLDAATRHARALRLLAERLRAELARTRALLAASPRPDDAVERGLARLVEFVTAFYTSDE